MRYSDDNKLLHIPIIVTEDGFSFFYGTSLPRIKEGTIAGLVVPEYAIQDPYFLWVLQRESQAEMFGPNEVLWVHVKQERLDLLPDQSRQLLNLLEIPSDCGGYFAQVVLRNRLVLRLRSTKTSELLPCSVIIPGLQNLDDSKQDAISLNHALTRISEVCEPQRKSHTGNVFDRIYFESGGRLWPLAVRRELLEAVAERELMCLTKPWWINDRSGLSLRWCFYLGESVASWILYQIDEHSIVQTFHRLEDEKACEAWLELNGYRRLVTAEEATDLWPPVPPYRASGEKSLLLQSDAVQGIFVFG